MLRALSFLCCYILVPFYLNLCFKLSLSNEQSPKTDLKKQYLNKFFKKLNIHQILSSAERNGVTFLWLLSHSSSIIGVLHPGSHLPTLRNDDGEFGFVVGSYWNILSGPNKVSIFSNYLINMTLTILTHLPVPDNMM